MGNLNLSQKEWEDVHNNIVNDVYPVIGSKGNFICFIDWLDYVSFFAKTKRLPADYLENEKPEELKKPINARDIEWVLQKYADSIKAPDDIVEKMLYIDSELKKSLQSVEKWKEKYPRDMFPEWWPD